LEDDSKAIIDQIIATGDLFENQTLTRNKEVTSPSSTSNQSEWTATSVSDISTDATPGTHETDNPLPVTLSTFAAVYLEYYAELTWTTQSEQDNAFWNIYRSISENFGQSIKINEESIEGNGTTFLPSEYEYIDYSDLLSQLTYWYWIESVNISGNTELYGPIKLLISDEQDNPLPPQLTHSYGLFSNFPNPFNPQTTIYFRLPNDDEALVSIYNLKGQKIEEIFISSVKPNKFESIVWSAPQSLPSGVYLYQLKAGIYTKTYKMMLLK